MGKFNSSLTRVRPVFRELRRQDPSGRTWLPKLLQLPSCGNAVALPANCDFTVNQMLPGVNADEEQKLDPPLSLLSWMIRHPQEMKKSEGACLPNLDTKRIDLLNEDTNAIRNALALLRSDPKRGEKNWYIFEGQTQPDVFIETPSLIVIIEGKRTEQGPTTHTRWMPKRHQIFRHIDGAWEIRGTKQVVGFFIVEGDLPNGEVPHIWCEFAKQTIGKEAIASSLPHRGIEEQTAIASCFAGVTTWQIVCRELSVDPKCLIDTVPERPIAPAPSQPQ